MEMYIHLCPLPIVIFAFDVIKSNHLLLETSLSKYTRIREIESHWSISFLFFFFFSTIGRSNIYQSMKKLYVYICLGSSRTLWIVEKRKKLSQQRGEIDTCIYRKWGKKFRVLFTRFVWFTINFRSVTYTQIYIYIVWGGQKRTFTLFSLCFRTRYLLSTSRTFCSAMYKSYLLLFVCCV